MPIHSMHTYPGCLSPIFVRAHPVLPETWSLRSTCVTAMTLARPEDAGKCVSASSLPAEATNSARVAPMASAYMRQPGVVVSSDKHVGTI